MSRGGNRKNSGANKKETRGGTLSSAANVLRLGVRFFALSECSILAQCLKAKTDAKPLL